MAEEEEIEEDEEDESGSGGWGFEVTPEVVVEVRLLSSHGLNKKQIAQSFGFSRQTFWNKRNDHPELDEALKLGKMDGLKTATSKLQGLIDDGDLKAIMYYLKTRFPAQWKEQNDIKLSGSLAHEHKGISEATAILEEISGSGEDERDEGTV